MLFDQRSSRLTGCCAFSKSIYRLDARRCYFVSNTSFRETIAGTGGFRGSIWTTETTRPNNAFEAAILSFFSAIRPLRGVIVAVGILVLHRRRERPSDRSHDHRGFGGMAGVASLAGSLMGGPGQATA